MGILEQDAIELLRKLTAPSFNSSEQYYALADDARQLLFRIDQEAEEQKALEPYRCAAQQLCKAGEVEVDDGAIVSIGSDPGAYVAAWVWVYHTDVFVDGDAPCSMCKKPHNPADFDLAKCSKCEDFASIDDTVHEGDDLVCEDCMECENARKARGEPNG